MGRKAIDHRQIMLTVHVVTWTASFNIYKCVGLVTLANCNIPLPKVSPFAKSLVSSSGFTVREYSHLNSLI